MLHHHHKSEKNVKIQAGIGFLMFWAFATLAPEIRRALCAKMVYAVVTRKNTTVLSHGEELDSWSVIR